MPGSRRAEVRRHVPVLIETMKLLKQRLPKVEAICRKYDVLLHVDEVINGFGRTGRMFGHQHYGISPDIMAVAKGIVSAYLPIAATVVKNRVFDSFLGEVAEARQLAPRVGDGGKIDRLHQAAVDVALQLGGIDGEDVEVSRGAGADFLPQHLVGGDDGHFDAHAVTPLEGLDHVGIGVAGPGQHAQHAGLGGGAGRRGQQAGEGEDADGQQPGEHGRK